MTLSISIHVPLAGNVDVNHLLDLVSPKFLSTFPLRGTSALPNNLVGLGLISIHVPLAGNVLFVNSRHDALLISIHVPLAGNVWRVNFSATASAIFLSTFPLRGTSTARSPRSARSADFYPRSPCGERRQTVTDYCHLFAKVLVTVNIQFWQRG